MILVSNYDDNAKINGKVQWSKRRYDELKDKQFMEKKKWEIKMKVMARIARTMTEIFGL
jgi:hypothetical protein